MYYEISNIIFKKKPTGKEIQRKYPFKHYEENVHLIEDLPQNLFKAYSWGFSIKPHPFNLKNNTLENSHIQCIVLDFDHLTKQQCDFVRANSQYGDYSAGTKTRLHQNRDIPDYENPKWGYKAFYPVDCICTFNELNEAFIEAVSHYNPQRSMDEVRKTWELWRKANNHSLYYKDDVVRKGVVIHKKGEFNPNHQKITIEDNAFIDWILPDVAMLNSFRTQITYGVKPDLEEDKNVSDRDWQKAPAWISTAKFPSGDITDYSGLEWKPDEFMSDKHADENIEQAQFNKWAEVIKGIMEQEFNNAKANPDDLTLHIPTSRSTLARKLKKQEFQDLPWDVKANSILNARLFAKEIDFEKVKEVSRDSARTLTRDVMEMRHQQGIKQPSTSDLTDIVHDTVVVVRQRCGLTILDDNNGKKGIFNEIHKHIVPAILKSVKNFKLFRTKMKIREMEEKLNPPHIPLLKKYIETNDKNVLKQYVELRDKWIEDVIGKAESMNMPYVFTKKGLKKWLISVATLDLPLEELLDFGLEPVKLKNENDWIQWCCSMLGNRKDELNEVPEESLEKWYKDYQREWNRKFGNLEGKLRKQHKQHKSKWDEIFKNKTKEEIESIISEQKSKQTRLYLRKKYLKDQTNG